MKDYKKVAERIRKMGKFSSIYNCGSPSACHPVNLCFELSEPYTIGYAFYVSYSFGKWTIDYTIERPETTRYKMQSTGNINTDAEMYARVEEILNQIRRHCAGTGG